MNAIEWLGGSLSLRVTIALLHFLWQGLAVAVLVVIAGRLLRQADARLRYGLNVAALLVMAACLPVTCALIDLSGTMIGPTDNGDSVAGTRDAHDSRIQYPLASSTIEGQGLGFEEAPIIERRESSPSDRESLSVPATEVERESSADERTITFPSGSLADGSRPSEARTPIMLFGRDIPGYDRVMVWFVPLAPYLASAYLFGVLAMIARLTIGLRGGERLRRAAELVADADLLAMVRHQAARVGMKIAPAVALYEKITVPIVVGVLQPMIVLPAALISGLTPDQLQALILHELAHIRRHDTLVNLLQRMIESLLFFHPAVWLVSRQVSRERELAADDLVLAAGWSGPRYADALVRMAELSSAPRTATHGALVLAASGTRNSELRRRVLRLLQPADAPRVRLTRIGLVTTVLVAPSLLATPVLVVWAMLPQVEAPAEYQEAEAEEPIQPTDQRARSVEPEEMDSDSDAKAIPRQAEEIGERARVDIHGDLLPEGVHTRIGTLRFRAAPNRDLSLAFIPGQQRLAGSSRNGGVGIWDVVSGKLIRELESPGYAIRSFDVSPDGKSIGILANQSRPEAGAPNTKLQVLDIESGEVMTEVSWNESLSFHSPQIAFAPNGQTVAVGAQDGRDGKVAIWDLRTGEELISQQAVLGQFRSLAFSSDGELLAVASDQEMALWNWSLGDEPTKFLSRKEGGRGANSVTFSPDGKWLATGSVEWAGVRVWNVATRDLVWRIDDRSVVHYYPNRIKFSSDSQLLLIPVTDGHPVTDGQNRLELREAATGKLVQTYDASGPPVHHAAISSDQQWIAGSTGWSNAHAVHVWNLKDGRPRHEEFPGHYDEVYDLQFTPDGRQLVTAPRSDSTVYVWDAETGEQIREMQRGPHSVLSLAVSRDGQYTVVIDSGNVMRVWNTETGIQEYELPGHGSFGIREGSVVAFPPDGRSFLSFGDDLYLRTWDIDTGKAIAEYDVRPDGFGFTRTASGQLQRNGQFVDNASFLSGMSAVDLSSVSQAAITPDGRHLLMYVSQTLVVVDTATGRELRRLEEPIFRFVASPDSTLLATVQRERRPGAAGKLFDVVSLRDFTTFEVIHQTLTLAAGGNVSHIQFSADGNHLYVPGSQLSEPNKRERFVGIHDTLTGEELARVSLARWPAALAVSPDGRRLATSHEDTTVLVWDIEQLTEKAE
jgi:WD40 repeat protein/beta-lactamase regulating signal transducer with metallopeptidase domain